VHITCTLIGTGCTYNTSSLKYTQGGTQVEYWCESELAYQECSWNSTQPWIFHTALSIFSF